MKYAVAIDVGGTNTRVALVNERLEITDRQQFSTNPENPAETLGKISEVIRDYGEKIVGVGMSCPGPLAAFVCSQRTEYSYRTAGISEQ